MAEEQTESKPKLDIKKILGIVFAIANLAVVGGGTFSVYKGTLGQKTQASSNDELEAQMVSFRALLDEKPVMYSMEPFNTNLSGFPRRFVRVEMSVEMYDKEGFEELVTLGGRSRDSITRILNSKKFDELETLQGKLHFKNEVIAHLNEALKLGVVKNVYFTKLQVQ
ncbi:MAG: flagellar basal body-associated FliL family protein [Bdellovibrionales bacterium]